MQDVFSQILYEMEHRVDTVLVTVIADRGSAPRTAGARMLVGRGERLLGTVGGGAVELRCVEMALKAIEDGESFVHDFVLRKNSAEDLGMVCGGDVTVLFNRIAFESAEWRAVCEKGLELCREHKKYWFVSPVNGGAPSVFAGGAVTAGEPLPESVLSALEGEKPMLINREYFAEFVSSGDRVIIFGAGHIARCLSPLVRTVGFRPVIFDDRSEYADVRYFPEAEDVICAPFDGIEKRICIAEDDYVVIMTNGHANDYNVQSQIMLKGKYAYLGVIGSRAKTAALNPRLKALGISDEALAGVHTPIGMNIRAVTPEELAVSIAGELIMVRAERRNGK